MIRETIMEGPSVAEALDAALEEMGVQQDAVAYEVLEEPGRGVFGRKGKNAKVRVWLTEEYLAELESVGEEDEDADGEEEPPEPAPGEAGERARSFEATQPSELSEDEIDQIADEAVAVLNEILACFQLTPEIEEYEGDEGEIILDIVGDDLGILIGRHGRTLEALQTVVSSITNRRIERRFPVVVDVSGYKYRRRLKIEEIAKRAADRAKRQGRPVSLRPMSSFERKVVHVALRNDRRVTTASEGEEPFRCVVIHPEK
ncbi:MAG: protein jag [Coriobacteriia bacterium]|jgi:Predicted RNA-binding protein